MVNEIRLEQLNTKNDFILKCKKCGKETRNVMGALAHYSSAHKKPIKKTDIPQYFVWPDSSPVEETPPKNTPPKKHPRPKDDVKYKCLKCGHIVEKFSSLYGHCRKAHQSTPKKLGYIEISATSLQEETEALEKLRPRIIKISEATTCDEGLIMTLQILVPTDCVSTFIIPHMIL